MAESEKSLFAIKMPLSEKKAMEFTRRETGWTLSKIYYQPLQEAIFEAVGHILINKIDHSPSTVESLRKHILAIRQAKTEIPNIFHDVIDLINRDETKKWFTKIFEGIDFVDKGYTVYEIDVRDVARVLGREYIKKNGLFDDINVALAKDIFFEYMTELYYKLNAVGSLNTLNTEWYRRRTDIVGFKAELLREYERLYPREEIRAVEPIEAVEPIKVTPETAEPVVPVEPVEPLEVTEVMEIPEAEAKPAKGQGGGRGKKRSRKKR